MVPDFYLFFITAEIMPLLNLFIRVHIQLKKHPIHIYLQLLKHLCLQNLQDLRLKVKIVRNKLSFLIPFFHPFFNIITSI